MVQPNKNNSKIDGTLTGITTLGQSGAGSNGKRVVIHTPQISKTGTSPINAVQFHTQDTTFGGGRGSGAISLQGRGYSQYILSSVNSVENE